MQKFLKSVGFKKMTDELEKNANIRILGATATESRTLLAKKPINTLDDLQNIKMRIPEIETYLRFWEALGTRPSRVTFAEVYMGLTQGVIDACEAATVAVYGMKWHEAARNVMLTHHIQSTYGVYINKGHWESLPLELQKIVQTAADEAVAYCSREALIQEQDVIKKMKAEGANVIEKINVKEWQDKVVPAIVAMEEKGMWRKGLYNEIQQIK
jgi:TRAP-type C4-dicarboxylate transport system substrate-binding protein